MKDIWVSVDNTKILNSDFFGACPKGYRAMNHRKAELNLSIMNARFNGEKAKLIRLQNPFSELYYKYIENLKARNICL